MEPELRDMLQNFHRKRRLGCPHVFHLNGRKAGDFRVVWWRTRQEASVPGMLFHDFRRTAIGNMIQTVIPERVPMAISGHKTRAVFDRNDIVSQDDLKEVCIRYQNYNEKQPERLQFSYTPSEKPKKVISLDSLNG